jgi:type VII secretion protein EccB
MASRRDQLQSYQFLVQRVISALVMRETDPWQSPLRRGTGALFAGIMIAVLVAAGFGVYGLLARTGDRSWRSDGAVVVERETGAAYVYRDGLLHPMLNYASALLVAGKAPPSVFQEPRGALAGVPRGQTLGIAGAPPSLPGRGDVVGTPWSLCAVPGRDDAGNPVSRSMLVTGYEPTGARALTGTALLVKDDRSGDVDLVWHGFRYPVDSAGTLLTWLYPGVQVNPVSVGPAWLDGLSPGRHVGLLTVPDQGSPSGALPGHRNGDLVYDQTASGPQYYLVFGDGLAPITELQKAVAIGQLGATAQPISVRDATTAPKSDRLARTGGDADPPDGPPRLAEVGATDQVCVAFRDTRSAPRVLVGGSFPALGPGIATGSRTAGGTSLADVVVVPPGRAAVVASMPSDRAAVGAYTIVTDGGVRYPVPSAAVLGMLGYAADVAVPVPAGLILRIPAGPTLDPAAAARAA